MPKRRQTLGQRFLSLFRSDKLKESPHFYAEGPTTQKKRVRSSSIGLDGSPFFKRVHRAQQSKTLDKPHNEPQPFVPETKTSPKPVKIQKVIPKKSKGITDPDETAKRDIENASPITRAICSRLPCHFCVLIPSNGVG